MAQAKSEEVLVDEEYERVVYTPLLRNRVKKVFEKQTRCTQYQKDECDINKIVGLYINTGILPNRQEQPIYADAPDLDFKTALDMVKASREEFNNMNPEYQKLFGDNSDNYFQFLAEFADKNMAMFDEKGAGVPETFEGENLPSGESSKTSKNGDSEP